MIIIDRPAAAEQSLKSCTRQVSGDQSSGGEPPKDFCGAGAELDRLFDCRLGAAARLLSFSADEPALATLDRGTSEQLPSSVCQQHNNDG